jgi:hypothetical protein
MDNSAFEMFKQNRPMYPSEKLLEMASLCQADYIVLTDYPKEEAQKTIDSALKLAPILKNAGFKTFFCPQSREGEMSELLKGFSWASQSKLVDYVGVSILAVPIAYGHKIERSNKLQRFLSRWHFMNKLYDLGVLSRIVQNDKKIHFLGMVDGPNEIQLVAHCLGYIDTWDSSAAVWAGLNNITFDDSPSGLLDGKFEEHVDFDHKGADTTRLNKAMYNVNYINGLIAKYTGV